jgi:hypothetical protein
LGGRRDQYPFRRCVRAKERVQASSGLGNVIAAAINQRHAGITLQKARTRRSVNEFERCSGVAGCSLSIGLRNV